MKKFKFAFRSPMTFLLYYLGQRLDLYTVGRSFFVGRTIKSKSIYGPGCVAIFGDNITIEGSTFISCDFFVVPEGTTLYAAHELRSVTISKCKVIGMTIIITEASEAKFRAGIRAEGSSWITYPSQVPIGV